MEIGLFIIILLCFIFAIVLYYNYQKKKEIENYYQTFVILFSKYPLYARRLVMNKRLIEDSNISVNEQILKEEISPERIKQLFFRDARTDDKKKADIEKDLKVILELYKDYPKALNVLIHFESSSMHHVVLNQKLTVYDIFRLSDADIVIRSGSNVQELQAIEKSIENIFRLDKNMYDIYPIKSDAKSIIRTLRMNFREYLYHFTHKENLKQIRELGGLYSWIMLEEMGKPCLHPGGTSLSRNLDIKNGVDDYVHLSFSSRHPMSYRMKDDVVVLLIHPIVCLLPDTLFSNMNATDKEHRMGPNLEDLQRVDFWAVKNRFASPGTKSFKLKQAEVLVKSFIPSEYIINLDYVDL